MVDGLFGVTGVIRSFGSGQLLSLRIASADLGGYVSIVTGVCGSDLCWSLR